jgi:hypothetical protein
MLVIRDAQMEALSRVRVADFHDRAHAHLRELWTLECRALGEPEVRALIERGVAQARSHGMTTEQQALCYLDLMFLLEPEFAESPRHGWARDILVDPRRTGEEKMEALYDGVEAREGAPGA